MPEVKKSTKAVKTAKPRKADTKEKTFATPSKESIETGDGEVLAKGLFKRVASLTLPHLKQAVDQTLYVKLISQVRESDVEPKEGEEPATIANVIDLTTGQEHIFIVPAVMLNVFEKDLAGDYADKCFEVTKLKKPAGKRYNAYEIYQIEA